jgi:hypothetical protein
LSSLISLSIFSLYLSMYIYIAILRYIDLYSLVFSLILAFLLSRLFHVFSYFLIFVRRGCGRTALEYSKLLLKLDYQDPLRIALLIDLFAIRSSQYQFLLNLFNDKYDMNNFRFFQNHVYYFQSLYWIIIITSFLHSCLLVIYIRMLNFICDIYSY